MEHQELRYETVMGNNHTHLVFMIYCECSDDHNDGDDDDVDDFDDSDDGGDDNDDDDLEGLDFHYNLSSSSV